MSDECENCGRVIGKLEPACVWQDHVVCAQCHKNLLGSATQVLGYASSAMPVEKPKVTPRVVVIEQTAKSFKKVIAAGAVLMIFSTIVACSILTNMPKMGPTSVQFLFLIWSGLFFVVGLGTFIYGRAAAWWNHG